MSEADYNLIQALARCRFAPGSFPKRFARSLASLPADVLLTDKQLITLKRIAWSFRKQLAGRGITVEQPPAPWLVADIEVAVAFGPEPWEVQKLADWNAGKKL